MRTVENLIGTVSRFAKRNEREARSLDAARSRARSPDFFLQPEQVFSRNARSRLFDLWPWLKVVLHLTAYYILHTGRALEPELRRPRRVFTFNGNRCIRPMEAPFPVIYTLVVVLVIVVWEKNERARYLAAIVNRIFARPGRPTLERLAIVLVDMSAGEVDRFDAIAGTCQPRDPYRCAAEFLNWFLVSTTATVCRKF